jgi:hypothetical protein
MVTTTAERTERRPRREVAEDRIEIETVRKGHDDPRRGENHKRIAVDRYIYKRRHEPPHAGIVQSLALKGT